MDDTTLTTVTIISLLLAWAMAIVSWQRVRAERRRSEARLATLMSELRVRAGSDGKARAYGLAHAPAAAPPAGAD